MARPKPVPPPRPPAPPAPRPLLGGGRFALAAALCLGLLLAAYSNFYGNAFQFDDSHVVVNNLYLRSLDHVLGFFTDARTGSALPTNQNYRPLVTLTLALDYRLAHGLAPGPFHADQLVELLFLGIALWFFYRQVMDRAGPKSPANPYLALFAAALFTLHTVHTETLNLMHARSEILSALGLVSGFLLYLGAPRLRRYHLYLLPVAAGALAKTPAVLFAPLLFAWELLRPEESERPGEAPRWGRRLRRATLAALPAFVAGVVLFWFVEGKMAPPTMTYGGHDRLSYALTQAWVWLHYLRLFFLPLGLTADTDLQLVPAWYDTRVLAGAAAIAALAVVAWRAVHRRDAWPVAFGLAWFAIGLLPTSSVVPLAEPMNEHRVFLPFIGLTLAAVWGARLLLPARLSRPVPVIPAVLVCVLILAAHAAGAHVRNRAWKTGLSLWADVTQKSPGNGRAWTNYGVALMARGAYREAEASFERAALLVPYYWTLEINRGVVAGALGNAKDAEAHFRRAIELGPEQPDTHFYFAEWLAGVGRGPEAITHLETAVRLSPGAGSARALLLDLRAASGDAAGAAALAREVLAAEPGNARARAYLAGRSPYQIAGGNAKAYWSQGLFLGQRGSYVESALAYRAALALDPAYADALNNLGWTLGKLGFFPQAVPLLEKAVAVRPGDALARNNLAWVKSRLR
jgi:tetratricopeptide (TPR) repeat protein